jgi:integrase
MSVFKRNDSNVYWYKFTFAGTLVRESAKTTSKVLAQKAETNRKRDFEESFAGVLNRKARVRTFGEVADEYLKAYMVRNPQSSGYITYAVRHLKAHLDSTMMIKIDAAAIKAYQVARLEEKSGPKTINEEVGELLRILGERGDVLRSTLKRQKALRLRVPMGPGKAYTTKEQDDLHQAASESRSPHLKHAQIMAKNGGMRAAELKGIQWRQMDVNRNTNILTIGKGKTVKGEGRTIPLNSELLDAIEERRKWYIKTFGEIRPEWYVFPFGRRGKLDPTRPVTTLKTAWRTAKKKAGVEGRWQDYRHNLVTELAESGAGDQTIRDIVGHVSPEMTKHYSHIRTKAKREALEAVLRNRQKDRDELKKTQAP